MNALNDRFAFEDVLRQSELASALKLRNVDAALADLNTARQAVPHRLITLSVFAALALISAAVFVAGYLALVSDTPAIWIHRLMALTIVQSILIGAVAMKLLPSIETRGFTVRLQTSVAAKQSLPDRYDTMQEPPVPVPAPLPLPAPKTSFIGGKLAGREYMEFDDGSIEIDTLIGRRRFISIDAAREFVGA